LYINLVPSHLLPDLIHAALQTVTADDHDAIATLAALRRGQVGTDAPATSKPT